MSQCTINELITSHDTAENQREVENIHVSWTKHESRIKTQTKQTTCCIYADCSAKTDSKVTPQGQGTSFFMRHTHSKHIIHVDVFHRQSYYMAIPAKHGGSIPSPPGGFRRETDPPLILKKFSSEKRACW